GQLGFQLRVMRPKAELHAAIQYQVFHPFEHRVDMRLSQPIRVKAFEINGCLGATAGEEARDDLLFKHPTQFPGHARSEVKAPLADVDREAASRANGIVDHLRRGWEHGLLAVVRWHHPTTALEH